MLREPEYAAPSTVQEACRLLVEVDGAVALAGGTDVVVAMHNGKITPALIVDLKRIEGLDQVSKSDDQIEIGALTSMSAVSRSPVVGRWFPALAAAASCVGCWQVRNVATLGGNLCNASPSADTAPPLLVYGATAVLSNGESSRELPFADFLLGPGRSALARGELLVSLRLPRPANDLRTAYARRSIRRSMDIPLVNVAVGIRRSNGRIAEARIALGAVAPVPFRATGAEQLLLSQALESADLGAVAREAALEARPITDVRATAEYRAAMVEVLVRRALRTVLEVAA